MKTLILLFFLTLFSFAAFAQNAKCLAFSNSIIKNTRSEIQNQSIDFNNVYFIKAQFPETYDLDALKMICDTTTSKTAKATFKWRLNSDKNFEKEYAINGRKVLLSIYFNDKFLYFEFPKE